MPDLRSLEQLSVLNMSYNRLSVIHSSVFALPLIDLNLKGNLLQQLPLEIGHLHRLSSLDISENKISCLPAEFSRLTSLTKLDISKNVIDILDSSWFEEMYQLSDLNLSNNHINSIKQSLTLSLPSIVLLDIKQNQLTDMDWDISAPKLKDFCISFNKLALFSSSFLKSSNLMEVIDLRDNQLTSVPYDILSLKHLKRLDVTNNNISSLQPELGLLQLSVFMVAGNPMRGIPSNGSTVRLLEYLQKRIVHTATGDEILPVVNAISNG